MSGLVFALSLLVLPLLPSTMLRADEASARDTMDAHFEQTRPPGEQHARARVSHVRRFRHPATQVLALAISPDGRLVAFGGADDADPHIAGWIGSVWIYEISGRKVHRLEGHTGQITSLGFSRDGRLLVSGSTDRSVRVWEVSSGREQMRLSGHGGDVASVSLSPDGRHLLSIGLDGTLRLWDLETGSASLSIVGLVPGVRSAAFLEGGSRIATVGADKQLIVLKTQNGTELSRTSIHAGRQISGVTFSSEGHRALVASFTDPPVVIDAATGRQIARFAGDFGWVRGIALGPDGRLAAIGGGGAERWTRLWDVDRGLELARFRIPSLFGRFEEATALVFSPDGRRLLSGGGNGPVDLWRVRRGGRRRDR